MTVVWGASRGRGLPCRVLHPCCPRLPSGIGARRCPPSRPGCHGSQACSCRCPHNVGTALPPRCGFLSARYNRVVRCWTALVKTRSHCSGENILWNATACADCPLFSRYFHMCVRSVLVGTHRDRCVMALQVAVILPVAVWFRRVPVQ